MRPEISMMKIQTSYFTNIEPWQGLFSAALRAVFYVTIHDVVLCVFAEEGYL